MVEEGRRFRTFRAEAWEKEKREGKKKKSEEREGNLKGFFPPWGVFFIAMVRIASSGRPGVSFALA